MRVMAHCHLFPGGFGEGKRDEFGIPGTSEHLVRFIEACGFNRAQGLSPHEPTGAKAWAIRKVDDRNNLQWLLDQPHVGVGDEFPIIPGVAIAPDRPHAVNLLNDAIARSVCWIKIHPLVGRSNTLDAACDPFYRLAEHFRMPIIYHTGAAGWDWPGDCAHPSACAQIAERFPALPILMAHCGSFGNLAGFEEGVACCQAHANLYIDSTNAILPIGRERWKQAIESVGTGKIVYGNDYPWCSTETVRQELDLLGSLHLTGSQTECILGGNFMKLHEAALAAR